jgi:phosphonate transport system substrate-binding protein
MKKVSIACCFILLFTSTGLAAEKMVFSMLPRYFPEKLSLMTTPLINHLSQELQIPVELLLTDNFASYENKVIKGDVDIGYENPLVYTNVAAKHEVLATAMQKGRNRFRGLVIVRTDAEISGLADLKGKTVMMVGKTSAGGYLSQKLSLQENGLDVMRDCTLVEAADNRQENVIIAVSIGDVDAGFIQEGAYNVADEFIRPNSIKKIAETAWLPNWALSVSKTMPQEQKERIRAAVVKLREDSAIMKAMELTGFTAATDADYDIIRNLLE